MNKIIKNIVFLAIAISSAQIYATNDGIPVDPGGDTIPIPAGNIPYFRMPNALAADKGEYTWDYSGTVKNNNQSFSLQATVAQFHRNGKSGIGFHLFNFTFNTPHHYFYSNSTYGGENKISQAVMQSMDSVQSSATLQQFSVTASSLINAATQWKITSIQRIPQLPLYKAWVGQPGQEYNLTGEGATFLWRYNKTTGKSVVAPYTYSFSIDVKDERGATMEGLGGGYVGPELVPEQGVGNVESEIAQPRLKVLDWTVSFQAVGNVQNGYQSVYHFSGNNGMLWNDFGPIDKAYHAHPNKFITLIQPYLSGHTLQNNSQGSGLYNGNWLPIDITRGKYAGASLVFSVFWNKMSMNLSQQSTDNLAWSEYGWCNFFSGLIPHEIDSASSMLETLYPENPALPQPGTTEKPPYKIVLNKFASTKYNLAFPWAQKITITIRANTPLRYALAAYADRLAKNNNADDPSQNLTITVRAISPITQNTLFSNTVTQYDEGAAIPTIHGEKIGYAWIEHMVNG